MQVPHEPAHWQTPSGRRSVALASVHHSMWGVHAGQVLQETCGLTGLHINTSECQGHRPLEWDKDKTCVFYQDANSCWLSPPFHYAKQSHLVSHTCKGQALAFPVLKATCRMMS